MIQGTGTLSAAHRRRPAEKTTSPASGAQAGSDGRRRTAIGQSCRRTRRRGAQAFATNVAAEEKRVRSRFDVVIVWVDASLRHAPVASRKETEPNRNA